MATVASLHIYPVKSCGGVELQEALLGPCGLESGGIADRQWMVVNESGSFVTQREYPRLARAKPRIDAKGLGISAPGMPELFLAAQPQGARRAVAIWSDRLAAIDAGDEAATWFSALAGEPVRLVRFDEREVRVASTAWTGGHEAGTRFADGYPILLISAASLADFNARWCGDGRPPLPMERYRPNIVIDGVGPYEEDYLSALTAEAIELRPVKPCPRCSIPSVDQRTGEVGPAPLELLAGYRFNAAVGGVVFGQNAIVAAGQGQRIRVGQHFTEQWNF